MQTETVSTNIEMNLRVHIMINMTLPMHHFVEYYIKKKYVHNRVINAFSQLNTSTLTYNIRWCIYTKR